MASIIDVQNLHYAYPPPAGQAGDPVLVLRDISFAVAKGQFVALLGRVGAGKSTLCMALNGLVPHATGGVFRGDVLVAGLNTKRHGVAELARWAGLVFQDPENQITQMQVEDEIAFGPENLGLLPAEIEERVAWALDATGLTGYRQRAPHLLSGGEKQRVAIAAMLALRPEVLVLDEPTASLDPAGKAAVFRVLGELRERHQATVFMATQEMEQISRYADRLLVLHGGRVALDGTPEEVFGAAPRLREWGLGLPQVTELGYLLSRRTGRPTHFLGIGGAFRQLCARETRRPGNERASHPARKLAAPAQRGTEIVVEQVSHRYEGGADALCDVSVSLPSGEFVALLGPNGSGKTTLAKQLDGLLKPTRGRVLLDGRTTKAMRMGELARAVGYVFQNPDHQIFEPTVHDEVAFGPRVQGLSQAAVAERVADALHRFRLTALASLPPAVLGFGQRRLVALAAVWATQPGALVLDEPANGLDAQTQRELMRVLTEFCSSGRTVVLITHDMSLVAEYAHRAIVLVGGKMAFDGKPLDLFSRPDLLAETGLRQPAIKRLAERLGTARISPDVLTPAEFARAWLAPWHRDEVAPTPRRTENRPGDGN